MPYQILPLLKRIDDSTLHRAGVIPWSCPVPVFGNIGSSIVATVGLNPSNKEFVDDRGRELEGPARRFETLHSLGLTAWKQANSHHVSKVWDACEQYFCRNPYDTWFKKLDLLISETGASYYFGSAAHLDLIPYATQLKWSSLTLADRHALLVASGNSLGELVRASSTRAIVLNGASVVALFERLSYTQLEKMEMRSWALRRNMRPSIKGYAYVGRIRRIGDVNLGRAILVLGYNHNIQSSFGVTKQVTSAIRQWIGAACEEVLS